MALNKKDFVEIEFTGRIKEGGIFDSNIREDLEKMHEGHSHPIEAKPFIFCLGEHMFLDSLDDFLIGKPDKPGTYEVELEPEKAFGKRDPALVKMVPMKVFKEHGTNPVPGTLLNFDGRIGKSLTVSGGRVMIDFNNPLAGKTVIYKIKVKRKVTDINEKVNAFNEFLFRENPEFAVEGKKILIKLDKKEKSLKQLAGMFKDKFKQIFDMDLEVLEMPEKNSQNKIK